jgi:hypothetical protein
MLLPIVSLVVSGLAILGFPLNITLFDLPGLLAAAIGYLAFRRAKDGPPAARRLGIIALVAGLAAAAIGTLWLGVALIVSGTAIFD